MQMIDIDSAEVGDDADIGGWEQEFGKPAPKSGQQNKRSCRRSLAPDATCLHSLLSRQCQC